MHLTPRGNSSNEDNKQFEIDEIEKEKLTQEILAMLPQDILDDLKSKQIDQNDSAFLDGLADHLQRLTKTNPDMAKRLMGKMLHFKKEVSKSLRAAGIETNSSTVVNRISAIGRNDKCPCGSGKKYKQCCMRKKR